MSLPHRDIEQTRRLQTMSEHKAVFRLPRINPGSVPVCPPDRGPIRRRMLVGTALVLLPGLLFLALTHGLRQQSGHSSHPLAPLSAPGKSEGAHLAAPRTRTVLDAEDDGATPPSPARTLPGQPIQTPSPTVQSTPPPQTPALDADHPSNTPQAGPQSVLASTHKTTRQEPVAARTGMQPTDQTTAAAEDADSPIHPAQALAPVYINEPPLTDPDPAEQSVTPDPNRTPKPSPEPAFVPQSSEMERHFIQQAQRNQTILELERSLRLALQNGNRQASEQALARLLDQIGPESLAGLQWQAFAAIQENRMAEAEGCYRRILALAPDDIDSACNLVLTLLRQNRRAEAKALCQKLSHTFPLDQRLKELSDACK